MFIVKEKSYEGCDPIVASFLKRGLCPKCVLYKNDTKYTFEQYVTDYAVSVTGYYMVGTNAYSLIKICEVD